MRLTVNLNLIFLVLVCPYVCGALDTDHGTFTQGTNSCSDEGPGAPVHCPDEGAGCLCEGALRISECRSVDLEEAIPAPFLDVLCGLLPSDCLSSASLVSGRVNWTGCFTAGDVQVCLQRFRC